jgi:hypothetical protein
MISVFDGDSEMMRSGGAAKVIVRPMSSVTASGYRVVAAPGEVSPVDVELVHPLIRTAQIRTGNNSRYNFLKVIVNAPGY